MAQYILDNYQTDDKKSAELYGLLFHYSHYTSRWACFNSGEKREYFNGNTTHIGYGKTVEEAFRDYKLNKHEKI